MFELDFEPFNAFFPKPTLNKSIGNGMEYLNHHISSKLFNEKDSKAQLLEFLQARSHNGQVKWNNNSFVIQNSALACEKYEMLILLKYMNHIFFDIWIWSTILE